MASLSDDSDVDEELSRDLRSLDEVLQGEQASERSDRCVLKACTVLAERVHWASFTYLCVTTTNHCSYPREEYKGGVT